MAATTTLVHLLRPGDEIIAVDDIYGGTNRYFNRVAAPFSNLVITLSPLNDIEAFKNQISEKTKVNKFFHNFFLFYLIFFSNQKDGLVRNSNKSNT